MKDAVLILSGGMDSTTMLYEFSERIALALSFNYGSNHNAREIPLARYHCEHLGIRHEVIDLAFMPHYFASSLLSGAQAVPEGSYDGENLKSTVVPFRNAIMLSIAVGIAESSGLQYVMMANHGGDHAVYPDCSEAFIEAFDAASAVGTHAGVHLLAPYTRLNKTDIALRGKRLQIDYAQTWSCYKGESVHCGKCATCIERREALAAAGIDDTTVYQE